MPHPNASKGARWELWCASFLGLKRITRKGDHDDVGDLGDDPLFVHECKDDASRSPMQWWTQAEAARVRAGKPWSLVLSKARMPRPGQPKGWAQMDIAQWREIREYIRYCEIQAGIRTPVAGYSSSPDVLRRGVVENIRERLAHDPLPIPPGPASEREDQSAA